ncbi:MAG: hypothetical protein AAB669_03975 [Patescibacteria group bacterium]
MFAPLLALTLLGQSSLAPSPFIGTWEGTLTFTKDGREETWQLDGLVVDHELKVTGHRVYSTIADIKHTVSGEIVRNGDYYEIRQLSFRYESNRAVAWLNGPIQIVGEGEDATIVERKQDKGKDGLTLRDTSKRNPSEHTDHAARIKLHRKTTPPGP